MPECMRMNPAHVRPWFGIFSGQMGAKSLGRVVDQLSKAAVAIAVPALTLL